MPISRIIEMTGINSTNYFHTLFKKRFGTTPGQYRQNFFVDSLK